MELFGNVYSFWALALVLLCAGNGLFFLTCSTYPKWPWKSTVSMPVSAQKKSKRRKKKDSNKVQTLKTKEGSRRDDVQKDTVQPGERELLSDVDDTANKREPVTVSDNESAPLSSPSKATKKEIVRLKKGPAETPKPSRGGKESGVVEKRVSVEERQESQTQRGEGEGKKHRKGKQRKSAPSTLVANGNMESGNSEEQRSDQESGEGWFLVSSGGKAKVSRTASGKDVAIAPSQDAEHHSNKPDKRGSGRKIPISIDTKPTEVSSLVDVFDLSLAELKDKESRYLGTEAVDPLQKIIGARIVDIQQNNESNGFAASAAVASVHHLKQTLMGDSKASRTAVDMSKSGQQGQFAHQQLAYEHQIRTSEIQREFMKSAGNLGSAAPWSDPVGSQMQTLSSSERLPFVNAGQSGTTTIPSGWTSEAFRQRYNYGQNLQSSFEFVAQRNIPLAESEKLSSIECDEGSIAFRRRESNDFTERQFDRVESRISDTTEDEYSVIDTIMSSEFSRHNNSNGSMVDAVDESLRPEFGYDDERAAVENEEGFDDIDLIDEYSMITLTSTGTKPSAAAVDRTAAGQDESSISSSLTFHGREHTLMGKLHPYNIPQAVTQASQSQQVEKLVRMERPSDGSCLKSPLAPVGTPSSVPFRQSWAPPSLAYSCADQMRNGFPTYTTHRQFVMLEAMRAVQNAFDIAAGQKKPQSVPRQAPYVSGKQATRQSQTMHGAT